MKFKINDKVKVIKSYLTSGNKQLLEETGIVTRRRGEGLVKFDYEVKFTDLSPFILFMEDELDFDRKIVSYRLIREYPGSESLNSISSEDWSKHPEFWEPAYEEEVVEFGGYVAEYCQNGVMFGCKSITIKDLDVVHKILLLSEELNIAGFNLLDALLKGKINLNIVGKLFGGIETAVIMRGNTLEELKEKKAADLPF